MLIHGYSRSDMAICTCNGLPPSLAGSRDHCWTWTPGCVLLGRTRALGARTRDPGEPRRPPWTQSRLRWPATCVVSWLLCKAWGGGGGGGAHPPPPPPSPHPDPPTLQDCAVVLLRGWCSPGAPGGISLSSSLHASRSPFHFCLFGGFVLKRVCAP